LYVSLYLDQYYTNGLNIFYKQVGTKIVPLFDKKIHYFNAGQKMYNPYYSNIKVIANQDRPYAGYIYASYAQQFISSKHLLKLGIDIGVTGKKSKAEEAQNFIHQFYNIQASDGWNTQIKEIFNFGMHLEYVQSLLYNPEHFFQLSWTNNANFSTVFTNISSGLAFKFNTGKNNTLGIDNSSFLGTSLQSKNESWFKECYLGIKSFISYQITDKTVTGKLANNPLKKSFNTKPWVWHNDIGYYWNLKNWNVSYHQIFHTKNTQELRKKWIRHGSIQLSYKF